MLYLERIFDALFVGGAVFLVAFAVMGWVSGSAVCADGNAVNIFDNQNPCAQNGGVKSYDYSGAGAIALFFGIFAVYFVFNSKSKPETESDERIESVEHTGGSIEGAPPEKEKVVFPKPKPSVVDEHVYKSLERIRDGDETIVHCPVCQEPMIKRLASKGRRKGCHYWGCVRYPLCKGYVHIYDD